MARRGYWIVLERWVPLGVAVAWLALIAAWRAAPLTLPVDDAYYYLRIARNVARGAGVTFDGASVTSGFHPLWLGCLVPVAAVLGESPDAYARGSLALGLLLVALGTALLVRGGWSRAALVLAVATAPFHAAKILVNGQESALVWLLMCACLASAARSQRLPRTWKTDVMDGALAGLLVLSRLAMFPFALVFLARPLVSREGRAPASVARSLGAAALVVAPYAGWLLWKTRHVVTVSAAIKLDAAAPLAIGLGLGAAVGVAPLARRAPVFAPLVAQVAAQGAVDVFLRGMPLPEIWTLGPHLLFAVLLVAGRAPRWTSWGLACVCLGLAVASWSRRLDPQSFSVYASARRAGEWVAANTPREARVAGWDCGIAALYADRTFFSLDGLVGSWDYKERYLDRGRIDEFLADARVDYVVQYVPREILANDPAVSFKDAHLGDWGVSWVECGTFASAAGGPSVPYAYFVLLRAGGAPRVSTLGARPCP